MDKESPPPIRGLSGPWLAILYVVALTAPLLLAHLSGLRPQTAWREAASAAGIAAGVALMLQFVTSGRFEPLSGRIGIDVTMAFHKWSARALAVVIVIHPLLFMAPDFIANPGRGVSRFLHLLVAPRYLTGVVAAVFILAVVVLAVSRDRIGVRYEAWRASHGIMALIAAGLVVLHALRAGSYSRNLPLEAVWPLLAAVVLASALIVYALRTWRMRRSTWRVVESRKVADRLWELTLRPSGKGLAYRAGQFAWLAFGRWRFPLLDHPFSIASAPSAGADLSFVIKESGDFTDGIGALTADTKVGLDAPHGSFVLDDSADPVVLVAGGVGIAPILGLIRELKARGDRRAVRLIYGGARPDAMIDPARLGEEAAGLDFKAIFLAEEAGEDWPYQRGRLTPAVIEQALEGLDRKRVAAMLCGPGVMMCVTCDLLRDAGVPLAAIRYERFDYADKARSAKDRKILASFAAIGAVVAVAIVVFALR